MGRIFSVYVNTFKIVLMLKAKNYKVHFVKYKRKNTNSTKGKYNLIDLI